MLTLLPSLSSGSQRPAFLSLNQSHLVLLCRPRTLGLHGQQQSDHHRPHTPTPLFYYEKVRFTLREQLHHPCMSHFMTLLTSFKAWNLVFHKPLYLTGVLLPEKSKEMFLKTNCRVVWVYHTPWCSVKHKPSLLDGASCHWKSWCDTVAHMHTPCVSLYQVGKNKDCFPCPSDKSSELHIKLLFTLQ